MDALRSFGADLVLTIKLHGLLRKPSHRNIVLDRQTPSLIVLLKHLPVFVRQLPCSPARKNYTFILMRDMSRDMGIGDDETIDA